MSKFILFPILFSILLSAYKFHEHGGSLLAFPFLIICLVFSLIGIDIILCYNSIKNNKPVHILSNASNRAINIISRIFPKTKIPGSNMQGLFAIFLFYSGILILIIGVITTNG